MFKREAIERTAAKLVSIGDKFPPTDLPGTKEAYKRALQAGTDPKHVALLAEQIANMEAGMRVRSPKREQRRFGEKLSKIRNNH